MYSGTKRSAHAAKGVSDAQPPPAKKRKTSSSTSSSSSNSHNIIESQNTDTEEKTCLSDRDTCTTVFILAHGAGTTSKHANIQNWKERLQAVDPKISVVTFDFKRPFAMDKLVQTFSDTINETLEKYGNDCKIVLIGCSMGSRAAVNLASMRGLPKQCKHVIALGYPLYVKKSGALRDEAVVKFVNNESVQARLLFVSGTKDVMAPADEMEKLHNKLKDKKICLQCNGDLDQSEKQGQSRDKTKTKKKETDAFKEKELNKFVLKWIDGADHSLKVGKRHPLGLERVHRDVVTMVTQFCFPDLF